MERWMPQNGTTGNDINTKRRTLVRTQTWTGSSDNGFPDGQDRVTACPLTNAPWIAADPRIPARLTRRGSVDLGSGGAGQDASSNTRETRYSHRTTDSERTNDSDFRTCPDLGEDAPVFPIDTNSNQSLSAADMDPTKMSEAAWRSRMSEYVSGLPNFALGSVTRDFTQKRRRLFSDNSQYHDAVSLEKHAQARRYRKGTMSSSGSDWSTEHEFVKQGSGSSHDDWNGASTTLGDSTFSRLSSCSSHDSIQHWVDSLDDNDNDVTVISGHHHGNEVGAGHQHGANQVDNIPGLGQQLPKKGSSGNDGLGSDAQQKRSEATPRRGPGGRMLERRLTNSQLIEQAQQHRTIQGRRQQLLHMGGSGVSDTPSDYSVRTASSIAELLLMRNDPEEILLSLGFGGSKTDDHLDRIPHRFLQQSRMRGISVPEFLHRMEELERGYGFNTSGGLRGLEFVLDRHRSNSLLQQNSIEQEVEEETEQTNIQPESNMGGTTSAENPPVDELETPREPTLQEIYEQRQPPHLRRILNRWDSSFDSRDSGPLSSRDSRDSMGSESSFDLMSRNSSLDAHLRLSKNQDVDNTKEVGSLGGKDVFRSSADRSHDSSVEQDPVNVSSVSSRSDHDTSKSDPNGNIPRGALTEEQRNQIRAELMLRAQILRARMMIPEPQLAPVDEESESEGRSPFRAGSLDTGSDDRLPDGRKSSATSEEDPQDDRLKSSNIVRTMSTPEFEHYGRTQKKSPLVGGKKPISPSVIQKEVKGQSSSSCDDSNKLKPMHHKVAERILKDTGHTGGGQESFEIEEISSTENQDENGSPANKHGEKPAEHGTLSRNPSTQSDSSGFADEGDTPANSSNGNHSNSNHRNKDNSKTMATAEVQTSFDTPRLDSYDLESRSSSIDSTFVSPEDVKRLAQRRESFRKSRGTSIVTSATFSSIGLDDDDAFFVDDDVPYEEMSMCGRNTPVEGLEVIQQEQEYRQRSRQNRLRRSGTFPSMALNSSHLPETDSNTSSLHQKRQRLVSGKMYTVDTGGYCGLDLSSRPSSNNKDKMNTVNPEQYGNLDLSSRLSPSNRDCETKEMSSSSDSVDGANVCGHSDLASRPLPSGEDTKGICSRIADGADVLKHDSNVLQKDNSISQSDLRNLLPVCAQSMVPSNSKDTVTETTNYESLGKSSNDPVHIEHNESSTEPTNQAIPQCISPTYESWDVLSSPSRSSGCEPFQKNQAIPHCISPTHESWDILSSPSRSPGSEPFQNYSPVLSPPPSVTDELAQANSSKMVLPDTTESNPQSGSASRVWQVIETAHHLEQHRRTQYSPHPKSVCTSELNARCEPIGASPESEEGHLRSSLEMDISGVVGAEGLPKEGHLRNAAGLLTQLTEEDQAENWYKLMESSTPSRKITLPSRTLSQYESKDVEVLQKALDRYKGDLASLEATSNHIYGSVQTDITESDRCELEALGRIRRQIMGEIATMQSLLQKKLQFVTSEKQASRASDEAELLAASTENLDIIKEMIGLLEEQRSMQHFLQDLGSQTEVLDGHLSSQNAAQSEDLLSSSVHGDVLVQELLSVKRELVEYRALARKELQLAISELKHGIMADVRREFTKDTNNIRLQLQAKDDEIKRLRALLGETDDLEQLHQPSPARHRYEEVQKTKDELQQLKDLLLQKNPRIPSQDHNSDCQHLARNGKR